MVGHASDEFTRWVRDDVAPIAHANDLAGSGPVFRRRDGPNWILFALERRRIEPYEALTRAADRLTNFRMIVGVHVPATRPAWDDRMVRPPGLYDIGPRSPSLALEPPDGKWWHTFDADDPANHARLAGIIRVGLPDALRALGPVDARALLERKLAFAGPLENLAPGHAEELLALADEAGADDIRRAVVLALRGDPVPDPTRPTPDQWLADTRALFPGLRVESAGGWPKADGAITPPFPVGRRVAKTRARLLADLAGDRANARRIAAARLAGWSGEPEIIDALRVALVHPDAFTRLTAASSLGHLGDADPSTWERAVGLVEHAAPGPRELGEAIVLLARQDLSGRHDEAVRVLHELTNRYPAYTRALLAFARDLE